MKRRAPRKSQLLDVDWIPSRASAPEERAATRGRLQQARRVSEIAESLLEVADLLPADDAPRLMWTYRLLMRRLQYMAENELEMSR